MFQWHVLHECKTISKSCIALNAQSNMDHLTCKVQVKVHCVYPTLVFRILSLLFICGHFEDIESKQGNTCTKSLNETNIGK